VLVPLFVAYQLCGTDISTLLHQNQLRREFKQTGFAAIRCKRKAPATAVMVTTTTAPATSGVATATLATALRLTSSCWPC
jgi:hypothetical protein